MGKATMIEVKVPDFEKRALEFPIYLELALEEAGLGGLIRAGR